MKAGRREARGPAPGQTGEEDRSEVGQLESRGGAAEAAGRRLPGELEEWDQLDGGEGRGGGDDDTRRD